MAVSIQLPGFTCVMIRKRIIGSAAGLRVRSQSRTSGRQRCSPDPAFNQHQSDAEGLQLCGCVCGMCKLDGG